MELDHLLLVRESPEQLVLVRRDHMGVLPVHKERRVGIPSIGRRPINEWRKVMEQVGSECVRWFVWWLEVYTVCGGYA